MADFPAYTIPPPPILTPMHPDSLGMNLAAAGSSSLTHASSAAWVTANSAHFYPFKLTQYATVYQMLFYVGATSSGNIDLGIYTSQLNLIVSSGSTGMSASVNTVQEVNITDTLLPPGGYYMAAGCDNTTGTCFRVAIADEILLPEAPAYQQTGLTGPTLTNPGTPAISAQSSPPVFVIGIQLRSVF